MRISVVAGELPHPEETAVGRDLWAWCEGIRSLGHELDAWVWLRSTSSPEGPIPSWCRYEPFEPISGWRGHGRAILHPRQELALAGWEPASGAVAVADHLWSFAAVSRFPRSVATFHFRTTMDAVAVRRFKRADIQMARAERIAGRQAGLVLAYSERVGHGLAKPAHIIPIAYPVPEVALAPVSEPIAALMADWSWPPNQLAASWLLSLWPEVRDEVPGARLLLAGRNLNIISVGYLPGVELVGEVRESAELLGQAAVMAFPCPTSSGPKVKVLEALAHGLPVVTTSAGMEGLVVPSGDGAVISDRRNFARALAGLLADPERRASLGDSGRAAVARHHSPLAAARARIKAFEDGFGTGSRAG